MLSKLPVSINSIVFLLFCFSVVADAAEPLRPASLIAEGGNQRVYLEWNPSTFDAVTGYRVYRSEGEGDAELLTPGLLEIPEYRDENVSNGTQYWYTVTGMTADGSETPHSNRATATPAQTQNPQRHGSRFVFPDGQEITFDANTWKLISWKSAEGEELAVPAAYGSPVALTGFDERGLSFPDPATPDQPVMTKPISQEYSRGEGVHVSIDDGRVTIGYRIPLQGFGSSPVGHGDSIWATVWQTWWPVEYRIGPTVYRGLARRLELDVPGVFQDGFQLNLNDAFGFDGSCKGAVSYRAFTWGSRMRIVAWDPETDDAEVGGIRTSYGRPFHPDQDILNVHPFLFVDHPKGTLIFTARRQHYAIHAVLSNYAAQGKDGLWPNFAVDLDNPNRRFAVDTFEYLYSPDRSLEAPQRYLDARFHYFRRMAERYGHPTEFPGVSVMLASTHARRFILDEPAAIDTYGKTLAARGIDLLTDCHYYWLSAPYITPELMHHEKAAPNQMLSAYAAALRQHGVQSGFWFRPETVMAPRGALLSERFSTTYGAYAIQAIPRAVPLLEDRGIPLIRDNTDWIRRCRGGLYPDELGINPELVTAYNWTPMSLKGGWYDNVVHPTFKMAQQLGFTSVFLDGGFGGFTGVEYIDGRAVAMQPYYNRLLRTASHFGLAAIGECGIGAGVLFCFGPSGEGSHGQIPWMFAGCPVMPGEPPSEQWFHRLHQLYTMPFETVTHREYDGAPRAHLFAREFRARHGHPRRIILDGLRLRDPGDDYSRWEYDRVFWELPDGSTVEYPNELPDEPVAHQALE